ncbi:gamma carbonic anhydrase family protein [Sphaerisporangium melleum]|uniref:Gamma carbonic anhydrase family protein n=1 Tax=Sphaerisporangium melleum TaxID=321316 RepID=A0A917R0P0_9ACTN|nr:gamma carbonic anhydrase family protein [Sphaerisporangium melleum]GGK80287.1 gamma carbonic anhydrase family protein [Sphaerisporangium melleum]GII72064.1 gamma carbonic anhydrase family protein [Sphaerisporangium melleum]
MSERPHSRSEGPGVFPASPYVAALTDAVPVVHPEAYVAPTAVVVGRVRLGRGTSVWYGSVLRGDDEAIEVGDECNIQDLCCLHADPGLPAVLDDRVSLGHRAVVHGARVETGALVGIGAVVLNGATIGAGSLVAAGCVVTPGKKIPAGVLVAGVPGKVVRELTDDDRATFARTPDNYLAKAARHRAATPLPSSPGA